MAAPGYFDNATEVLLEIVEYIKCSTSPVELTVTRSLFWYGGYVLLTVRYACWAEANLLKRIRAAVRSHGNKEATSQLTETNA